MSWRAPRREVREEEVAVTRIPLSVLDLVPVVSGSSSTEAICNTVELARATEQAGYHRYWLAEHHLNPGVAGSHTPLVISFVATATSRIRVGSGAVQMGHQTPLSVVEQFGLLDAAFPGRIDLGLGRSGARRLPGASPLAADGGGGPDHPPGPRRTERGLLIPEPFSFAHLIGSPRFAAQAQLLQQPGATAPEYAEQVEDVLALLSGTYRSSQGVGVHASPGDGAGVEVWILGSSGGESAQLAGKHGLAFGANYHVAPAAVLEAVTAYREAFQASPFLDRPRVLVSADVVVGPDDETAQELASGYAPWVRSIRTGSGAIPYPTPEEARLHQWTDEERAMVADRVDTQFVGSPETVVAGLEILAAETGADELLITTITHDQADRIRSYQLLASAWRACVVPAGNRL
jgi:alkanesulfonate monooxygenase SsuD/methylene tetrahydromethanopterin reductase-like flavin-dependent oxidoreductase (luciferase family)